MPRRPRPSEFRPLAPYGILALGLVLTAIATFFVHHNVRERDLARFRNAVSAARDRVQGRLDTYEALLLATRSLLITFPSLELRDFRRYVRDLDLQRRYPGIQGVGFTVRISPAERAELEQEMRRQGHSKFEVWPEGNRSELHSILFLEPLDRRNAAAIGYDMFSEAVRREAMARARDTARPAATRRVTLVQEIDPQKQAGFLLYVPVYRGPVPASVEARRDALWGFVYSPFRVGDLFAGVFGSEAEPPVAFAVFDGERVDPAARMTTVGEGFDRYDARLETVWHMDVAGVTWSILFRTTPAFEAGSSRAVVPVLAVLGVFAAFVLFFLARREVSARAEAEVQRNNLHALFSQAPAAIAIVRGPDFRYELSNPLNRELAGRELVGRTVADALPELEAQGVLAIVSNVYRTGEPFVGRELPIELRTPEGGKRIVYLNAVYQPFHGRDGTVEGVMVFAYEVTDLVRARQKMEAIARDLETAVRMRDDFLSIAGHELRTPLAALKLHIEGLQRLAAYGAALPPRWLERLDKAATQVDRLERLIGELLDVSRIAAGRLALHRERMDLGALVQEVADRFAEPIASAGCSLSVQLQGEVSGEWDRARLDQVVSNLLANAIKYGGGGTIEIGVSSDDGNGRLTVRDHGIGIAGEDTERIFGRFERAVSERHYGGLGLGLWITREIVHAHGGRIEVESAPGQGSTFTVELPKSA